MDGRGTLTHSHSQPGGIDRSPPGTPLKGRKMLAVRVQMLDDTVTMFQVQAKALGRVLFDQVCKQLNLLEADYFGLEYDENGNKYWLDLEKPLSRQIGLSLVETLLRFCVKFYTPDPSQLEEEFTRYLFCLQIKRDLNQGLLQCNDNTAALMASYIVQAECGDYVAEDYPDHKYLSSYKFVPNQDQELERRIMENHKKHAGQSPAEADINLLETARRCELYGVKMHPAKDHEGVPLNLAVAHMGILVFQNYTKINTFSWAKIRKISFKRKKFLVKLHPEGYGFYKDTVEFFFDGRNECKNFWKKCVENHGFFRCTMVKLVPRHKTRVLSRGSSFRYSGRTQKQMVEYVRDNYVKRQTFQRSQSFRHSSSVHASVTNVGASISAHPLLPLGDNAVVGTPASLSCGSMTLNSMSPVHTAEVHGLQNAAAQSPSPPLTTSLSPGTSVTSSPQHFYPHETPPNQLARNRTGHLHSKTTATDFSPAEMAVRRGANTDVATSNRSTSHSRRSSVISPFNDVYSASYESVVACNQMSKSKENMSPTDYEDPGYEWINEPSNTNDGKIYSSSYPGSSDIGSRSLDQLDSQEDVSHDSYELLDHINEVNNRKYECVNRSRSCSWSYEKLVGEGKIHENGFRSLERTRSPYQDDYDRRRVPKVDVRKRRKSKDFDEDEHRRKRRERHDRDDCFHEGLPESERRRSNVSEELKYERVVSNQFGKYSDFLSKEEVLRQERKVYENYEKVCQVGRIARELDQAEKLKREILPQPIRALVERTKSDPYETGKNLQRNVLTHQKSIDLTPQDSSDYEEIKKSSRSENDIPYTLHKRHCMNGTAKDSIFTKAGNIKSPKKRHAPIEIINMDEDSPDVIKLVERHFPKTPKPAKRQTSPKTITDNIPEPIYAQVIKTPPEPAKRSLSSLIEYEANVSASASTSVSVSASASASASASTIASVGINVKTELDVIKPAEETKKPAPVARKREESLILFARTRLGQSEGSAFTPITRRESPNAARRTKSLDAPIVSLHSLPPANAFSSKDDTVDTADPVLTAKPPKPVEKPKEIEEFKEAVSGVPNRFDFSLPEEKVLDSVRNKRLLSKIESLDGIDSDTTELSRAEIPPDRIVDLPVSVRFPSVRQMSGQTSEESEVWEEVKVKRRTPRRSTGRDDPEPKESVVWDSKDEEQPDDDVWDDSLIFSVNAPLPSAPHEYLKRGSCGQSIDDDNLSTPIKESSPDHWVSVDDLPEALEREERMLREQEKILHEKILHEKLKRELNLDTIEVEESFLNHNFEDMPLPVIPSEKFKGHSLDTYELTEKRLREKGTVKNPSLDEQKLHEEPLKKYLTISTISQLDLSDKSSSYENVPKLPKDHGNKPLSENRDYIKCKVINDISEIQHFNDDDEFVVVLNENLGDGNEGREVLYDENTSRQISLTKDDSIYSAPDEFKTWDDSLLSRRIVSKEESVLSAPEEFKDLPADTVEIRLEENGLTPQLLEEKLLQLSEDGRLTPYDGSRRSSENPLRSVASDDPGHLTPYDSSSRRSSEDPRAIAEDSGRLSPYDYSRRSSDDPRRLSTSDDMEDLRRQSFSERDDSRKYSISEDSRRFSTSISEETRRRLSSTEETRRKRASLTKQCSVGVDSLSDEMIPGIQECSSSFEQDDKDVFDWTPAIDIDEPQDERTEDTKRMTAEEDSNHLVPPKSERELSRETEDSMDYGEGDFKDIREVIIENVSDGESKQLQAVKQIGSLEKSESSEGSEMRFIDDKRGSTPEMIVGKSKECAVMAAVVVKDSAAAVLEPKAKTLPTSFGPYEYSFEPRHTLPKMGVKLSPEYRKLDNFGDVSQDSSQESETDRYELSVLSHIQGQVSRRNLIEVGKLLDRDITSLRIIDTQKRDSGEEMSASSSNPPVKPKRELSSTWRPFLLESSGSSSLEEGWLPPDDNAHLADEEETSSTSNNPQDDSFHDDIIDYPSNVGFSVLNLTTDMMSGGYNSVFALSRTLSRISERSTTSEQERSEEEDATKPSSHSASVEEESILSSDHQPSLSSDPPSPRAEPFDDVIPPPLPEDDWPSPPESSSILDTPVVSHVETFYLEIQPEEVQKVTVSESHQGDSSSDENQTLQDEGEFLQMSSDNLSYSTTTTTQDGTVVVPVRPPSVLSEELHSPTGLFETPVSKVRSPTAHLQFFEKSKSYSSKRRKKSSTTGYYSRMMDTSERSYFDTGSLDRTKISPSRKCTSYYSVEKAPPSEEDSSSNEAHIGASSNTIPRASKRSKRRHRVAMDLQIRDGKIVAPPTTKSIILETSDSDKSGDKPPRGKQTEV